jgi:hypothetical protein
MKQVPEVGSVPDTKRRERLERVDSVHHQNEIDRTRKFIYENGARVNSAHIDAVLFSNARVPTRVSA